MTESRVLAAMAEAYDQDLHCTVGYPQVTGGTRMTDPLSLTIGAGEGLTTIAERLGILDRLKRKLMKQPDVASAKLETVLIEMSKIYGVLQAAVNDYLSLWLVPDDANKKWRAEVATLRRFASGAHEAEMRKAKGDCKKIWNIYVAFLQPWFSRVLSPAEADELFGLFRELSDVDSTMVDAINATSTWLTNEATTTLRMVLAKEYDTADQRIQSSLELWQPAAGKLRDSMNRLYDLQASFIVVSRAV
jgi:hypothetical protein